LDSLAGCRELDGRHTPEHERLVEGAQRLTEAHGGRQTSLFFSAPAVLVSPATR